MNDVVVESKQPARLIIPDIPAVSSVDQSTATGSQSPDFLNNTLVTTPVANIAVVTLKPVCKPIIGMSSFLVINNVMFFRNSP